MKRFSVSEHVGKWLLSGLLSLNTSDYFTSSCKHHDQMDGADTKYCCESPTLML